MSPSPLLDGPNMAHVVAEIAASHPDALRNSCQEHGGSWEFIDLVVDALRRHDTRWGYNWKRWNEGDPSQDLVNYHRGPGHDDCQPAVTMPGSSTHELGIEFARGGSTH